LARKDVVNSDGSLNLTKRTQEIVEYVFANPSLSQKQIAAHFQVRQSYISQIMNSTRVMQAYPILAKRRMRNMVPKAMKRFEELMEQTENLEVSRKVTERALQESKVLDSPEINVNLSLKDVPNDDIVNKLKGFGAVGPIFEAHVLHEDTPSDGKADVTPNSTPNPEPNP
jgi:predicted XRE-type DNA-binding protein